MDCEVCWNVFGCRLAVSGCGETKEEHLRSDDRWKETKPVENDHCSSITLSSGAFSGDRAMGIPRVAL